MQRRESPGFVDPAHRWPPSQTAERPALERWALEPASFEMPWAVRRTVRGGPAGDDRPEKGVPAASLMTAAEVQRLGAASPADVPSLRPRRVAAPAPSAPEPPALPGAAAAPPQEPRKVPKPRWVGGIVPPPPWAGGHTPRPHDVHEVRGESGPVWGFEGNFYGHFFGWGKHIQGLNPISPVDRAAYYHDQEYFAVQDRYGYARGEDQAFALYLEPLYRFDRPEFMYELAMADLRMNENTLLFMSEGIEEGFYKGKPDLLLADMFAGSLAFAYHSFLALMVRLPVFAAQTVFGGLWDLFSGKISLGDYMGNLVHASAQLLYGAAYAVAGTVRGILSFGVSVIKAIINDPVKGLGGVAAGAAIGSVLGPVGAVVGGVIGGIVGGGGCWITTAVVRSAGLADDCDLLQLLRHYRDTYLARRPGGRREIEEYYRLAPRIVEEIEKRPDADRIWSTALREYLVPAAAAIRLGEMETAYRWYRRLVDYAERAARFGGEGFLAKYDASLAGVGKPLG